MNRFTADLGKTGSAFFLGPLASRLDGPCKGTRTSYRRSDLTAPGEDAYSSLRGTGFAGERRMPMYTNPTVVAAMMTIVQRSGPPNRLPPSFAGAG
jgi:hypothetical protein